MGTICRGHRDIGNSRKHVQPEPVLGREPDYSNASGWTWRGAQCLGFSLRPKVRVLKSQRINTYRVSYQLWDRVAVDEKCRRPQPNKQQAQKVTVS